LSDDAFERALEELVDFYLLARGCPCRFPRFRATVGRSTHKVAGGSFTTEDQRRLIHTYEKKVPLGEKQPLEGWGGGVLPDMYQATCTICGSLAARSSNEFANGGWIDYLQITRAKDVIDLGARVESGKLYRPRPWISPGPGMTGIQKASEAFPFLPEDEWLAWMREVAPATP
jgi:hypothetical protein